MDCGISHQTKPVRKPAQSHRHSRENHFRDPVQFQRKSEDVSIDTDPGSRDELLQCRRQSKQRRVPLARQVIQASIWVLVPLSLPRNHAMATPQIRTNPEIITFPYVTEPLTISTRHDISSTHGSVTIEKLAHPDRQSRSQDATNRKKEKTLCLFFIFFFSSAFILVPPRGTCQRVGCHFLQWHNVGGWGCGVLGWR